MLLALAVVAALVWFVVVPRWAAATLDGVVTQVVQRAEAETGGEATLTVEDDALPALLDLRRRQLPVGRLVVVDGQVPDGPRFSRAELAVTRPGTVADAEVTVPTAAIADQIGAEDEVLDVVDGQLVALLGPVSLPLEVTATDGRVVVEVPTLPPPFDELVASGLADLVPPPPAGVQVDDVQVVGDALVLTGTVDLAQLDGVEAYLDGVA